MKSKHIYTIAGALITLLAMFVVAINKGAAQDKPQNFDHVIAIDGGQGTIRFFDTSNGRLYTYDRTLQKVIRVVELQELGQPAKIIQDITSGDGRYSNPRENW